MAGDGYNTRQKQQIFLALIECGARAVSTDELHEALRARGHTVGKTTVYRQLERLTEKGEARKVQSPDGAALYQYVGDASACERHMHCQCAACGRLAHVDCVCFDDLRAHLLQEHGFVLDAGRSVLLGLCQHCREE